MGGRNSELHSGSKLCSAILTSQPCPVPRAVTQQDGAGRATVQMGKGSDCGFEVGETFLIPTHLRCGMALTLMTSRETPFSS